MDCTRVLLVDDDADVRQALGVLLDRLPGCALAGAVADVDEAVAAAARLQPDVVVIDAELPGALAAVSYLRARGRARAVARRRPAPRIVLLSVYGQRELEALAAGADAYLLKDCGPCRLAAALRPAASGDPFGGTPPGPHAPAAPAPRPR